MQPSVIGERVATPSSIVFLVVKLRLSPPSIVTVEPELDAEETKRHIKRNEEKDEEFLASQSETEDVSPDNALSGWAHAPYWPGVRYYSAAPKSALTIFNRIANCHGGLSLQTKSRIVWWYLR